MSDLEDLLAPYLEQSGVAAAGHASDTSTYLTALSTLSLDELTTTEPEYLSKAAQSQTRNLQALAKKSYKAVIASGTRLNQLGGLLPALGDQTQELRNAIPQLDSAAATFAQKYDRSADNAVVERRKRAMLLSRNVDKVSDVLELPTLLSTTVAAGQAPGASAATAAATSYAAALDLQAHVKRIAALYPNSKLVASISQQAETEMANLMTILITALQSPNLKLATAMRTIGFLRRVAPDLADDAYGRGTQTVSSTKPLEFSNAAASGDGSLGALFLVCRLCALQNTLDTLEPLQELADQESARRNHAKSSSQRSTTADGSQTERYLKRYIEIFREHSFTIISTYKSIFPNWLPHPEPKGESETRTGGHDSLMPLPSSLASFSLHLVEMLLNTLREYAPNVSDRAVRESLLTQVLYCAGSLGRSGADFGMMLAVMGEDDGDSVAADDEAEWIQVMKKHRIQTGRLEVLARGVGTGGKKSSVELHSPGITTAPTG